MANVTIVALPEANDPIRKISSEKEPHLTLLFLGEVQDDDLQHIIEYVQHAVESSLHPFSMESDFRGLLGPEDADVLFFSKGRSNIAAPSLARDYFLKDPIIRKYYDATFQYPEWTPHVTLGYPDTPAKPDPDQRLRFTWVFFDRIAVWFEDYSGIEFRLKYPERSDEEAFMSDVLTAFFEHHGVKGMKWGVRKDRGHEGERATSKKIAKLDKKFEKASSAKYFAVYNKMAEKMNSGEIDRINNDPRFKDRDMNDWESPTTKAYFKEYSDTATKILNEASSEILGTNASGTKKWEWNYDVAENAMPTASIVDVEKKVKHADSGSTPVKITWNAKGISKIDIPESDLEQTDSVEAFFEHYGVKGMKWGVIRDRVTAASTPAGKVVVNQKKPGGRVEVSGGHGFTIQPDAAKAKAAAQVAKNSGLDALSTPELQALVTRMNLEQQYSTLVSKSKGNSLEKGQKQIKTILGVGKTYNEVQNFLNTPGGKIIKDGLNAAVKAKLQRR